MTRIVTRLGILFAVAFAAASCSDDDDGSPLDAGTDAALDSDAAAGSSGSRAGSGGSGGSGCRCSACNDSCSDMYDCFPYPLEPFPWPEGIAEGMARRAPLNLLCYGECDPRETLAQFEARLRCGDMDDGGVEPDPDDRDGGAPLGPWRRSEGCGSVQFSAVPPAEARYYNFDRETGELIGFAGLERFSIIGRAGFGCAAPAWVAGTVRSDCPGEIVTFCEVR